MKPLYYKVTIGMALVALAGTTAFVVNKYVNFTDLSAQVPPKFNIQEEPQPVETTLLFAGDIMLSREVRGKIEAAKDPNLPYAKVRDEIQAADISFANLESPFSPTNVAPNNRLVFQAKPEFVSGLVDAGFDVLSTANNHTLDQGQAGLDYTLTWLKQHGIDPVGTGPDCHSGVVKEANGMKFGFLAYSYTAYNDGGKLPSLLVCDWRNQKQVTTDIANMTSKVDFVIVSSHMGAEYKSTPDDFDREGAKNAISTGAHLVIGHHPHWVQTVQAYNHPAGLTPETYDKFAFHSLGNFVFDQMWSQETKEGLAVKILFKDKKLDRITLMPVVIDDYCCPRWANDPETKAILEKINLTSPILFGKN